jgi:hypothetical protein
LAHANKIRFARSRLKRDLKAGRASVHTVLSSPPGYLETATIDSVLMAVPKLGRTKVNTLMTRSGIHPRKTFGGITERQRAELLRQLEPWVAVRS